MFERFTDRARRAIVLAQEEARMLGHNYIGTEHILLGLIQEGEGVAARVLGALDISLEAVRSQVEEIIGQGQVAPTGQVPFTPRAKMVLELSLREALQLRQTYIGTEHILLGLIREGEGVAAQVLQKLGADLDRVRGQAIELLRRSPAVEDVGLLERLSRLGERALPERVDDLPAAVEILTDRGRRFRLLAERIQAMSGSGGPEETMDLLLGMLVNPTRLAAAEHRVERRADAEEATEPPVEG